LLESAGHGEVDDRGLEHRPQLAVGCFEVLVDEVLHGLAVVVERNVQALSLDPWTRAGCVRRVERESAFWIERIGSVEVLIH
jgi:hypothetical protein